MHHIVADGWSLGVLVREIAVVYEALRHGRTSPLAELTVQYPDFAAWQQKFLAREELGQQLAWWREQLAELPEPLDLPTDFPRPRTPQFEGGLVSREAFHRLARAAARDQPQRRRDLLHDARRRLRDAVVALLGPGAVRHRHADCQSHAHRDRTAGWLLRQHAGITGANERQPDVPRAARASETDDAGGLCPSGRAVREARRGTFARAQSGSLAAVPGSLGAGKCSVAFGSARRIADRTAGGRQRHVEI